jgi:hypothetical protein
MKKTLATIFLTLLIALPCFGAPPVPIQPGGTGTWGSIGGTIGDQADLATLLGGYIPTTWIVRAGTNNVLTYTGNYSLGITLTGNTGVTFPTTGTLATTTFKPSDLSITNQAAGDILYFNGTNWVRMAKGANSSIFGVNSAGTLGFYTSILIDNSAAQFKDSSDATKLWTISPVNFGTGVDFTFSPYVASDLSWSPTISAAGISTGVLFVEVDGHTDSTNLTAANVSRTFINSYDRAGAATLTLPAAAAGYSFVAIVGTQHNSLWKIQRAGSDTIYWDSGGTLTAGKTYFGETNQAVGSRVSCSTFRTGASAYSWLCGVVSGTWTTD